MVKIIKWVGGIIVVLFALGLMWPEKNDGKTNGNDIGNTVSAETPIPGAAMELNEAAANPSSRQAEVIHDFTMPQQNAIRSAKQYLNFQGFSRAGLIQQLSSDAGDGYTVADATAAVDSLNIDWNLEAERSAKQYLSLQGFSCKGLVQQLSSSAGEGYTVSQARHGAKQAGVC
ncbi:Ltp family lipoprotein [Aquitalea denitrificans]|uniref:Ltp family lipoprotein n=1 Tax=Aquitalea denitrificans TaxID=519081 RepID=UPI00135AFBBF|nr:Ltp family lipoprotein [Aquitalea denitrificans]